MIQADTQVQTTWGSRDGADADDHIRMIRLPRYGSTDPDGRKSDTFEYHTEVLQQLPAYDTHRGMRSQHHQHLITTYYD